MTENVTAAATPRGRQPLRIVLEAEDYRLLRDSAARHYRTAKAEASWLIHLMLTTPVGPEKDAS